MTEKPHIERRQRDISIIKEKILKAARKIAVKNGWPAVSIRKIAKEIEYTPPVIYEHFKNKEAILAELEMIGFQILGKSINEARLKAPSPEAQLVHMSEAYWNFTFEHKELYEVMYNLEGVQSTPARSDSIRQSGHTVVELLEHLHTFPAEREGLFFNWWALSHGFVSLVLSGQLPGMKEQLKHYYLDSVRRLVKGMD